MKTSLILASISLLAFSLNSCKDSSSEANTAAPAIAPEFADLFVASAPEGAVAVGEARKAIGEGAEEVIVTGMLVNNGNVFNPKAAMFFICDDSKIQREGAPKAAGADNHAHDHSHANHDHSSSEEGHDQEACSCGHDHGTESKNTEGEFDWCCTDPAVLKEALLPVQVVDSKGTPVLKTLKGVNNMTEKARVIVKGKPSPTSQKGAPILNATQIFVVTEG